LRYGPKGELVMSKIDRVSKPGCRVYVNGTSVPKVLGGMGINIISTSQGLMTDRRARREKVGGELLCRVY
jgi:small subunit ribosomal protein S8